MVINAYNKTTDVPHIASEMSFLYKINTIGRRIRLANQQQLDILLSGVQNWNVWRETHLDEVPDFSEANLEKLDLAGVNLRRTYCEHPYRGIRN